MSLLLWQEHTPPGHCILGSPPVMGAAKMHAGLPFAAEYAGDLQYPMSDLFPDDIALSDNFYVAGQVIVSQALMARLESSLADHAIEYLPVSIINHKGRVASDKYFIVHPLGTVDCIDLDRSKVKWNPIKKRTITSCKGLAFKPGAAPPGLKLFRPLYWGQRLLVVPAFADELTAAGFTGLRFSPAEGFNGISSP